jgi:branched-chain amino acid transport system permease protein
MTQAVVHQHARVRRGTRASWVGLAVLAAVVLASGAAPYVLDKGLQGSLVTLFSFIVMASMWNLLAGYGGMLSVGQQAYIGIGAYALVVVTEKAGLDVFVAVPLAVVTAGLLSIPISFLAFRLSGGYFAIGTWVIAEVVKLLVQQFPALGGGIGVTITAFAGLSPGRRIAYVYWLSLVGMVIAVLVTWWIMRSRLGLGFTAIRDDETAASSLGVRVTRSKRFVFVVSAMGMGLVGAMVATNTLRVQPESIFSVNYAVLMIFMVVIGGVGTIEGPIVGAIVFFLLQQWLSDLGAWYMVLLGVIAVVMTLFLPKGLWGLVSRGGRFQLFPVGYRLEIPDRDKAAPADDSAPAGGGPADPALAPQPG